MNLLNHLKTFLEQDKRKQYFEYWETDLFHLLRTIFILDKAYPKDIKKKRNLSEKKFEELLNIARHKTYVIPCLGDHETYYYLSPEGIDYLMRFKENLQQTNQSKWMMWATLALAISAIVNMIHLILNEPRTKTFLFLSLGEILSILIVFFTSALLLVVFIQVLFWVVRSFRRKWIGKR